LSPIEACRLLSGDNPIGLTQWLCQHPVVTTILIVDDHPAFRAEARRLLEASGLVVVGEAHNGATALAMTTRLGPDAILLDIGLPDMSGFAVVEHLRSAHSRPSVVLPSSRDATTYGDRIRMSGAAGFIQKDKLTGPAVAGLLQVQPGS
jgi:DNA-binding NarL/FixJ family response regulator